MASVAKPVRLPVIQKRRAGGARARSRGSRVAKWRAGVLIAVNVLMVAHVLHWWITGRSVGRFVLSDSMRTLETGEINPGFLLFVAAIGVTALLGRFMCGWVCHMGALQDLCAWLLRRIGVRPRLFRSRFLGFVPLGLALYMFVWPTFQRVCVDPVVRWVWPDAGTPAPAAEFPGWSTDLTTDALWSGLPAWQVAVPFLLLSGFATVYFLGARGLCRYGCPYGGFLLPVEQLAPVRVVVDGERCDQCGLCTAACTTGVRVHDEVRLFGAVADRNCVRSFDCVSACPAGALSIGITKPAAMSPSGARARPSNYDLTLGEEFACLFAFVAMFFTLRGLYDLIPMLLAGTLAVLGAYAVYKSIRLIKDENVRLGAWQLKLRGRWCAAGRVLAALMVALCLVIAQSVAVRCCIWIASGHDDRVRTAYEAAVRGDGVDDADRAEALRAQGWYALARPIWRGGIAMARSPGAEVRLAWVRMVAGDRAGAEALLREMAHAGRETQVATMNLARYLWTGGRHGEAQSVLEDYLHEQPRDGQARDRLTWMMASRGDVGGAEALYRSALAKRPGDADASVGLARLLIASGRVQTGINELARIAKQWPRRSDVRRDLASALFMVGRSEEALSELRDAAKARPAERRELEQVAANMRRELEQRR